MTVTPRCTDLFQTRRELHHFLGRYQQISEEKNQPQIVSLSIEINTVDPLVALQALTSRYQLHFYMEKRSLGREVQPHKGLAIAAIGAAAKLVVGGVERFTAAQRFIRSTLAHTTLCGNAYSPLAGPHFFCSFTFFDQKIDSSSAFPAATIVLPEWQVSRNGQHCLVVANVVLQAGTKLEETVDRLWQTWQTIRSIRYEFVTPVIDHRDLFTRRDVAHTQQFKQAVRAAITAIQQTTFHKVVLAHAVDVTSPLPFDAIAALHHLRKLYPGCYLFLTSNDRGQQFIGASPERLVSVRDGQLKTGALAGSAPRGKTTSEDAVLAQRLLASIKEQHEHRVVSQFICQQLTQLGLSPQPSPVRLLQLSNIQHLQTPIQSTVPADIHLLDVVATLHPTPAVAGMPRPIACDYIRQYEAFERSLYAAPIGWVDHHGNGEFAVGIRSAILNGNHARLFAGAGIVEGSDPDRELAEVQLKLQALLQALV
ncbi:MAG: isochorismate synthase [Stenomitos rutilans HA7619-LM2]|jgi:menaquinone-specific isochorismate synthase|nr:isochorismate synthase [Stenomitos rutilans HA7619-LM2]